MTISHHSHSGQFCLHAKGQLEDVVLTAISKGFTTFGLTEHIPRTRTQDLYPEETHLQPSDLSTTFDSYLIEAHRLRTQYVSQMTLLVGLETESIHPTSLDELSSLLSHHGDRIQYLVGSVHHVHERPIDFDKSGFDALLESLPGESEQERFDALFGAYFDAQNDLIERLRPEVIGHFDLCRLYYPDQDFERYPKAWEKVERNVRKAIEYGALFEVNASAFRKGWKTAYPGTEVFELIQSLGGRFTLSDDSHGPDAVGLHYDKAYDYLKERGLKELWYLEPATGDDPGRSRGVVPRVLPGRPWEDEWSALLSK